MNNFLETFFNNKFDLVVMGAPIGASGKTFLILVSSKGIEQVSDDVVCLFFSWCLLSMCKVISILRHLL